jgi:hypothetical protein
VTPYALRSPPRNIPTSTARSVRLLAIDQELGERAALRVAPELADPVGTLEVGQHQDVQELVAWSRAEGVQARPSSALELVGTHGRRRRPRTVVMSGPCTFLKSDQRHAKARDRITVGRVHPVDEELFTAALRNEPFGAWARIREVLSEEGLDQYWFGFVRSRKAGPLFRLPASDSSS